MSQSFCAQMSRESGEDLIGSAPTHLMYVLIECPPPWAANDVDSRAIPSNLRALIAKIKDAKFAVRFLLFIGESQPNQTRVIVFRKPEGLINGYRKREFEVDTIDNVAPLLQQHLTEKGLEIDCENSATQDIFVCTHGSHDKCCAKFGYPFYRQAMSVAAQLCLRVRIWQVSHIGGHRFAPTIVTFPDGRYYGALDQTTFTAILQRAGNIQCLQRVYRGWGILPKQVQVVEREIALQHGWQWFGYHVSYRILNADKEAQSMQVELQCKKPDQRSLVYVATVVVDETKSQYLMGSCNRDRPTKFTKFSVEHLRLVSQELDWTKPSRPPRQSFSNLQVRSIEARLK